MAGNSWSITIEPGTACAKFVPDVYSDTGTPPENLQAQVGDLVCWNNQTDQEHEIWITDADYQLQTNITQQIGSHKSSSPGYVPQLSDVTPPNSAPTVGNPVTIYYACSLHPDEHGKISVVA